MKNLRLNIDLLKLNEKTQFGNIFTDEDAKLIIDTFNLKSSPTYGELDPLGGLNVSLSGTSHIINKIWIEDNCIWGEVDILDTPEGKIVKHILGEELEDIVNKLSALNRENQMASVIEDDIESNWLYPSDFLKEKGMYFSLRGASLYGKLNKFFTFDIRTYDRETIFIEK
jgi:hypothetical protein